MLSDAEIKRIADMNLDDIIEDATSDSVSVEDLFGNGDSAAEASQENADEPVQAASQPEEKSDKASAEQAEAVQKQPDTTAAEAEQTEIAGTQTEKSEPAEQAETQTQAEPGKEQEAAGCSEKTGWRDFCTEGRISQCDQMESFNEDSVYQRGVQFYRFYGSGN